MKLVLVLLVLLSSCAAPTFSQRQSNWRHYRDATRASCLVGKFDPAMPSDVRSWCERVKSP